jgi:pimeloyl-ACP methyl ester carboxylesterase
VPPYLAKTDDNPRGPLDAETAAGMEAGLKNDREAFFDDFMTTFFSSNGVLKVSEAKRREALALCHRSDQAAALGCMEAFATTDFRADLTTITVPTLVIHGTADAIVPLEGSGQLTHEAVAGSTLVVVQDGPHGFNASHLDEFNRALLDFLAR